MTTKTALKAAVAIAALAVIACVGAFVWMKLAPRRVPAGQPPLNAGSLPAFQDAFNAAEGDVRILVMLSPT